MVSIVKHKKGNTTYYYLKHHTAKNKKQREIYLGKKIPQNIEDLKHAFLLDFYREEWLPDLGQILLNYTKQKKNMPKSIVQKELESFSIRFTYNTQKIEGSTLSLRETADIIQLGLTPASKPERDMIETKLHQKLFLDLINSQTKENNDDLSLKTIQKWHKLLFKETKADIAGNLRTFDVRIGGSKFVPPKPNTIIILLKEFFHWYHNNKNKINPVELAALVHLKFVTIHPFGDGNGRVSRLMMNFVLNKFGYPMFDISYTDRKSYYIALERSSLKNNDVLFLQWFMKRYIKGNNEFLN